MSAATVDEAVVTDAGGLVERLFLATIGAVEVTTVYLGVRLGLYEELGEPRTAAELAGAAGIDTRYAEEWLEQQATAGLVDVAEPGSRSDRRYRLTDAQSLVLADADSPFYGGSLGLLSAGVGVVLPQLVDAFRTGAGISFGGYGDDVRLGQALFNKTGFLEQLTQEWIPTLGVGELLSAPGATALDLGCGTGWSSIAMAQAYPGLSILGIDSDEASVMDARANAADAGVGDRVRFEVASADEPLPATYDVAFYLECLHDFGHPVESLAAVRAALKPGGAVVVMDERAEEEFTPDGSPIERAFAAFSVLHCLPVGRSEPDSAATGTLFRPSILREYAARAGFASVEVSPIEHDMFRFYVLR
ncbi:MAG TPA: class I SAM-dependent methyltransferase [Marmoricola sp.]|jgi:SAM-dependent methyltransferase|nr:class I SAM-dependent methyltransferase [Marmoricola sp.]